VHVTVVVPTGKVLPEAGAHDGVKAPSTTSFAVASGYVTTFPPGSVVLVEMLAGTDTTGGVVSWTTTEADALTGVPSLGVVLHVTVVVPSGNCAVTENEPVPDVPGGVSQVAARSSLVAGSIAFTWYVAWAPSGPVASTVSPETRSAGGAGFAAAGTSSAAAAASSSVARRRKTVTEPPLSLAPPAV
jgi:hypothetical protein